jgi:CRISPR-associated endonuclease Cas2
MKIRVEKRLTRGDVSRALLELVKISGVIIGSVLTPKAMEHLHRSGYVGLDINKRKVINSARSHLIKSGYISINRRGYATLTPSGAEKLKKYELKDYQLIIPKMWDKKWRMLIFDIPEHRRYTREKVRNTLRSIGFMRLQDSVWVFPYDCSDLITLLKADFKIGKDLLHLIVDEIENDKKVREFFQLG